MLQFYLIKRKVLNGWLIIVDRKVYIDKKAARRSFEYAANSYDKAAVLQTEIGTRMLNRLDYVKLKPKRIVDIGCGTGLHTEALLRLYPKAILFGLDFAFSMVEKTKKRGRIFKRPIGICGDLDSLPLATNSCDLIFSNAALQWSSSPDIAVSEMQRILKPGGLLMFSSFGPDTLKELREAWSSVGTENRVHQFIDMHQYGDMLMQAGFSDPVMDTESLCLTYTTVRNLMQDLKSLGASNASLSRSRSLTGPKKFKALTESYEQVRNTDGRLPASFEVIYGHAWGSEQRSSGSEIHVPIDVIKST